jgi:thymidylate synthase
MIYTRPQMQTDFCRDGMSDFMCTNAVQYLIRDGKMHASVSMRSNDLVYGYKNDRAWAYHVLNYLMDDYNSLVLESDRVELGNIYWNVGSLHVYSKHYHLIEKHFDHEHTAG